MRYIVIYDNLYKVKDKDRKEYNNILRCDDNDETAEKHVYDFHERIKKQYKTLEKDLLISY